MRRRVRASLRWRILPIPCLYISFAIALGVATPAIDHAVGTPLQRAVGLNAARDVLTATSTGMVAFTALVVASVLLVIQFASSQYSPRLVLWFRRDILIKNAIGSFLAAPLFGVVALREIERKPPHYSPDVTVVIALVLLVGAAILFLALLQRIQHRLEPRSLYQAVAREGIRAIRASYPLRLEESPAVRVPSPAGWRSGSPQELRLARAAGVLVEFDPEIMVRAGACHGVTIEVVPAVGEFISQGQPLLRIHGDGPVDSRTLLSAVTVGEERTTGDPVFAIRIVVDTAIRALSQAINDPTTAVHAIDALEPVVGELAARDLEQRQALDGEGVVRLVWRAPSWEDFLDLAFEEIRAYGANSIQVCRRLRAALEELRARTPHERHPALDLHLARLHATVQLTHPSDSPDRSLAEVSDRTGVGLAQGA
jgi:uncharacterized membrane protein